MGNGMKLSIKAPGGAAFKLKGPPQAVSDMADKLSDHIPTPNANGGIESAMPSLSDDSLPRAIRTQRERPSIPFKFRYRGSGER